MFGFKNRYRKMPDATLDAYAQNYLRIIQLLGDYNSPTVAKRELKKIHKEQDRRRKRLLSMWVENWME